MIKFEQQITEDLVREGFYKQFKNAFDKENTYLKIELLPTGKTLYFNISNFTNKLVISCVNVGTREYFNLDFTWEVLSFEKSANVKKEKTSKKTKNNSTIHFTANSKFLDELNNNNSIIVFITKEEYEIDVLKNRVYDLEECITKLKFRMSNAEENIKTLDEKKSNKFFI